VGTGGLETPPRVDSVDSADTDVAQGTPVLRSTETRDAGGLGAGDVLAQRYRLLREIGHGGMGSVWEAEHLSLASPVAVKLIDPRLVHEERARARFLREARAAATLRGAHVVQIFDYGVHDGTPYIAMELLHGESLARRLQRCSRLDAARTLELITHVGRAVGKAHEAGVIHRDLKPDNIFIVGGDEGEIAKVLDFGIAKAAPTGSLAETTETGAMLGTPHYMSPEQLRDAGEVDGRSDLWSMGVIAYECIIGQRPFIAESMGSLVFKVMGETSPVPSEHGSVPPGFDAWFAKATARDPARRFQDARELVDALAEAFGDGSEVLRVGVREPAAKHPRARMFVAIAMLVAAAGIAAIAWSSRDRERERTPAATVPTDPVVADPLPAATPRRDAPSPDVAVPPAAVPSGQAIDPPPVAEPEHHSAPAHEPKTGGARREKKARPAPDVDSGRKSDAKVTGKPDELEF
jgi:hypothetical protein